MVKKMKLRSINVVKDIIAIVIGVYLITVATNVFLLPHKMTVGGASGIATIFYYIFNIPMGISILLINVPLFIISIYKFGLKFSIKTILTTILLSVFLEVFRYDNIVQKEITDLFTSCVFGGIITGVGLSLVLKAGASTGGSDLLAQIINKYNGKSIADILLIIEGIIIFSIMIVFKDINVGLYSIISLYLSTKVIDILFSGINYIKVVTVITRKKDKILKEILNDLKRGATVTVSLGAHSNKEIATITCIVSRPQISKIKDIVIKNDNDAIMYITSANEAIGNGFNDYDKS